MTNRSIWSGVFNGGILKLMAATSQTLRPAIKIVWRRVIPVITPRRIAIVAILLGVALRAAGYFFNAALYVDEGAISLNIISRSFAGLFSPLDFNQAAPIGFLLLEKIAVLALGDSEYSLRLVPFLCSIASLFLFYFVARRVLCNWLAPFALLLFAVSSQVVYYSTQVKQYSSDVLIALVIVLFGLQIESKELTMKRALLFALMGATVVWISHPSVFALAGAGVTLALVSLKRKQWRNLIILFGCYATWLASFAAFYLISLSKLGKNQTLESSWDKKGTFMPLIPRSLADLEWFPDTFIKIFTNPLDSPFPLAAAALFLIGCFALLKKRKSHLLMMISPVLLTLLASGLHKYPFGRRLLLFVLPLMLVVVIAGVEFIAVRARSYSSFIGFLLIELLLFQLITGDQGFPSIKRLLLFIAITGTLLVLAALFYLLDEGQKFSAGLAALIMVFLSVQPVGGEISNAFNLTSRQDIRPIMAYVRDHKQPGDIAYVYHHQKEAFLYYAPKYGFNPEEYFIGADVRDNWVDYQNEAFEIEMQQFVGRPRVWSLFSHVRSVKGVNEEHYMVEYLDEIGKKLDKFKRGNASVYLYDLSSKSAGLR